MLIYACRANLSAIIELSFLFESPLMGSVFAADFNLFALSSGALMQFRIFLSHENKAIAPQSKGQFYGASATHNPLSAQGLHMWALLSQTRKQHLVSSLLKTHKWEAQVMGAGEGEGFDRREHPLFIISEQATVNW